jgi:hypothetical protein
MTTIKKMECSCELSSENFWNRHQESDPKPNTDQDQETTIVPHQMTYRYCGCVIILIVIIGIVIGILFKP